MADNVTLNVGSGGSVVASDDIGGVHYQIVKLTFGALDSQTIASSGNGATDAGTQRVTIANDSTGTVAATQSGTWNITNVSGTVSLPTGAATAANQSTANSSLSNIDTNTGAIVAAEGAALGSGVLLQGDDGTDRKNVNVDATTGDVQVDVTNTVTVDNGGTFAVQAAQSGTWNVNNVSGTVSLPTGAATAANQSTANSSLSAIQTAVELLDNAISGNEMQVDVVASLPAGTNNIGDVDIASAIPAGTNMIGRVEQNVSVSATGTTTYYDEDLDETKVAVDAGAVNIYSIQAFNTTAAPLFLQLFNVASGSVTVGTTKPTNQYVIPGNADSDGAGFTITFGVPKSYDTALTIACTTNSEGSSAPGAGACIVNIEYAT